MNDVNETDRRDLGQFSPDQIVLPPLPITPDHSELLFQARLNRFAARVLSGERDFWGDDFLPATLAITLARLCDKAVDDYWGVEEAIQAYKARAHRVGVYWLMIATNRMEAFINALHRSLGVAESIRRNQLSISVPSDELPNREDRYRLRGIRDQIEHMDGLIRTAAISPGDPSMLVMNIHSVELGGIEVSYDELAWWTAQVSNVVTRIRFNEES